MRFWKRLRTWRRRRHFEEDLAEEIRLHREQAGARFGSAAIALEDSRAVWGFAWLDSLAQDFRYAVRGFRKNPGFALTAAGTIGLALGLNTTVFTIFNAYVLKPVAVRDPHALYQLDFVNRKGFHSGLTWQQYQALRNSGVAFSDCTAGKWVFAALDGAGFAGQMVTANYFDVAGAGMYLGRPLTPEDRGGAIVLSYSTWKNRYGSDPLILGRKVYVRGEPFEIVGVAAAGFGGFAMMPVEYWLPLDPAQAEGPRGLTIVGRLKLGQTVRQAAAALEVWARAITAADPEDQKAVRVQLESRASAVPLSAEMIVFFMPVFVSFTLVLAIACANVANIMLARALARQREIAIRVSLGAGRRRLIRQLLTESLLLALPAAVAGFLISSATVRLAQRLFFATFPPSLGKLITVADLTPDFRVFGFILLASAGATLLFGLAPAIQTTRSRLVHANRGDFSSDYRPVRLRNFLVMAQVAVSALLLISAGVLMRGEQRMSRVDLGVDSRNVFQVRISDEDRRARAVRSLEMNPSVEVVAGAGFAPLAGAMHRMIPIRPSGTRETVLVGYNHVTSEYFAAFRILLLRGRNFLAGEGGMPPGVVIVSEDAARRLWPGRDALGQSITVSGGVESPGAAPFTARVIGIARNVAEAAITSPDDKRFLYFPSTLRAHGELMLLVRMKGPAGLARASLDSALNQAGPSLAEQVFSAEDMMALVIYPYRVAFWIAGALGAVALLLTTSGLFGVLTYLVGQRTREIGIRVALGAGRRSVVALVVRQSFRLCLVGTLVGAAAAIAARPVLAGTGVKPFDALAYASAIALILAASLAASYFPSRRAAGIDPMKTLRCD